MLGVSKGHDLRRVPVAQEVAWPTGERAASVTVAERFGCLRHHAVNTVCLEPRKLVFWGRQ